METQFVYKTVNFKADKRATAGEVVLGGAMTGLGVWLADS